MKKKEEEKKDINIEFMPEAETGQGPEEKRKHIQRRETGQPGERRRSTLPSLFLFSGTGSS